MEQQLDIDGLYRRDLVISKLRRYVASLEHRLAAQGIEIAAEPADVQRPVGLLTIALDGNGGVHRPQIWEPETLVQPRLLELNSDDAFEAVSRVEGGILVHPRPGRPSVGCLGPFEGPPPILLTTRVENQHPNAPRIGFAIELVCTQLDDDRLLYNAGQRAESAFDWAVLGPADERALVASRAGEFGWAKWAILLATRSLDDPRVEFGWATFKDLRFFQHTGERVETSRVI